MRNGATQRTPRRLARGVLRVIAAASLAVDAWVHAKLAGQYDLVKATVSQGDLFRAEAALAALAALLVLVWRRPLTDLFAWLVAAGGLALLLVYRYVDVGTLGPLPDMYEPSWYRDKWIAVVAEAIAVIATTILLATRRRRRKGRGRHAVPDEPEVR
jgi:peptidoglycan/LPS O-acetylase OafA/YrhL